MLKATVAGKPIDYTGFLGDAHWWFFCFVIVALNFLLLAFDPLPKLFMGDSGSYLWTACTSCKAGGARRWGKICCTSLKVHRNANYNSSGGTD